VKHTTWSTALSFSADGTGVVAHAGNVATRLLADQVGLTGALSAAMARRGFTPTHDRGRVLVDVAVLIAGGGEAIADIDVLRHQSEVLGPVASAPTEWRTLSKMTPAMVKRVDKARARVRAHVWSQLAGCDSLPASKVADTNLGDTVVLDVDAAGDQHVLPLRLATSRLVDPCIVTGATAAFWYYAISSRPSSQAESAVSISHSYAWAQTARADGGNIPDPEGAAVRLSGRSDALAHIKHVRASHCRTSGGEHVSRSVVGLQAGSDRRDEHPASRTRGVGAEGEPSISGLLDETSFERGGDGFKLS